MHCEPLCSPLCKILHLDYHDSAIVSLTLTFRLILLALQVSIPVLGPRLQDQLFYLSVFYLQKRVCFTMLPGGGAELLAMLSFFSP